MWSSNILDNIEDDDVIKIVVLNALDPCWPDNKWLKDNWDVITSEKN